MAVPTKYLNWDCWSYISDGVMKKAEGARGIRSASGIFVPNEEK